MYTISRPKTQPGKQRNKNKSHELFALRKKRSTFDHSCQYSPQNSNSSPDYAEFGLAVYTADGSLVETYSNLNLDPTSGNYIVKVIGDEFQTVNNDGEITVYGDYPNASRHIRVGDYK